MALPFLDSITDFCEEGVEEFLHHAELPTKQNLYCDGRRYNKKTGRWTDLRLSARGT